MTKKLTIENPVSSQRHQKNASDTLIGRKLAPSLDYWVMAKPHATFGMRKELLPSDENLGAARTSPLVELAISLQPRVFKQLLRSLALDRIPLQH